MGDGSNESMRETSASSATYVTVRVGPTCTARTRIGGEGAPLASAAARASTSSMDARTAGQDAGTGISMPAGGSGGGRAGVEVREGRRSAPLSERRRPRHASGRGARVEAARATWAWSAACCGGLARGRMAALPTHRSWRRSLRHETLPATVACRDRNWPKVVAPRYASKRRPLLPVLEPWVCHRISHESPPATARAIAAEAAALAMGW